MSASTLPEKTPDISLPDSHHSLVMPTGKSWIRKFMAVLGPGFIISVGYMDPGNWATDLAGGSRYGYKLLWVILISNLLAILLQSFCSRLGLVTGRDLAQACRDNYKRPVTLALWFLSEIAIVACDLAEVIGSAVALKLLFHIPMIWGVLITGLDVMLLLGLLHSGFRKIEAIIFVLISIIAVSFQFTLFWAKPDWRAVGIGTFTPIIPDKNAILISLGILGATVMPHNLYLHSSIVQTRVHKRDRVSLWEGIRLNELDTVLALGAAFFVNAAIMVLAAAVFHSRGVVVEELQQAHELLTPMLGKGAAIFFAVALLASGQSSTITGTLAGQIVMEGFLAIRVAPWLRRIITRSMAIIPAIFIIHATGETSTVYLLVISQVILSMQLSFAVFPLLAFTSDRKLMGEYVNPNWLKLLGYLSGITIATLNLYQIWATIGAYWLGLIVAISLGFALWVKYCWKEKKQRPIQD